MFATGQGRKTDPIDAHSVAVVGLRSQDLRHVTADDATVALLVDRRDELRPGPHRGRRAPALAAARPDPGRRKKFLTRGQAAYLLRTMPPPVDTVARTRHQLATELVEDLTTIDAKLEQANKQLGDRQLAARPQRDRALRRCAAAR